MAFLKSLAGAVGTGFDYLTPGRGSSRLTDWGSPVKAAGNAGAGASAGGYKPITNFTAAGVDPSFAANQAALNKQIQALQNQLAYQPKLVSYDVLGNYNRARSTAEAAVNPLYNKYLNDFLAQAAVKQQNKRTETDLVKGTNALDLQQTLEGNQVNRTRTEQDTAAAIQQLGIQEGDFQQESGTQFDQDRRALAEQTAASGLTTSGLGQGVIYDQNVKRNLDEAQQVREFANQREAKNLFKTRTFEDLARGDKDANNIATNKNKLADFDLEQYLDELAADESNFRNENEAKRLGDIADQTQSYAAQGTQSFLQSLAGAGWRPQDIALAYQVYG